jgi:Tfp pilus assembly protein PilX
MKPLIDILYRRRKAGDKGAILMVVLIVMVALLGLGMTGLFLTSGSIQMNTNINLRNQALVVAEAGIERARGILNNRSGGWVPPISSLLAGSVPLSDEIPGPATDCEGSARGAILIDQITPSCTTTPTPEPCKLNNIDYPSVNRSSDLPASAGSVARTTMGQYTVYICQDQADCRMGNYTCDYSREAAGIDAGVGGTGGTTGLTACTAALPANIPPPNGSIVIRSEGVASDGRTRVVLEVTMSPGQGGVQAQNMPMSALCSAGASGCDDNTSVQNGIVVNSPAPEKPPVSSGGVPSAGGASGAGGAGGATTIIGTGTSGGATGTGGTATGGVTGTGGATGTGGSSSWRPWASSGLGTSRGAPPTVATKR